jgi:hypothetical protein
VAARTGLRAENDASRTGDVPHPTRQVSSLSSRRIRRAVSRLLFDPIRSGSFGWSTQDSFPAVPRDAPSCSASPLRVRCTEDNWTSSGARNLVKWMSRGCLRPNIWRTALLTGHIPEGSAQNGIDTLTENCARHTSRSIHSITRLCTYWPSCTHRPTAPLIPARIGFVVYRISDGRNHARAIPGRVHWFLDWPGPGHA